MDIKQNVYDSQDWKMLVEVVTQTDKTVTGYKIWDKLKETSFTALKVGRQVMFDIGSTAIFYRVVDGFVCYVEDYFSVIECENSEVGHEVLYENGQFVRPAWSASLPLAVPKTDNQFHNNKPPLKLGRRFFGHRTQTGYTVYVQGFGDVEKMFSPLFYENIINDGGDIYTPVDAPNEYLQVKTDSVGKVIDVVKRPNPYLKMNFVNSNSITINQDSTITYDTVVDSPITIIPQGLWGLSDNLFYLGGRGAGNTLLILKWNGIDWRAETIPDNTATFVQITALHGISENFIVAGSSNSRFLKYNGSEWKDIWTASEVINFKLTLVTGCFVSSPTDFVFAMEINLLSTPIRPPAFAWVKNGNLSIIPTNTGFVRGMWGTTKGEYFAVEPINGGRIVSFKNGVSTIIYACSASERPRCCAGVEIAGKAYFVSTYQTGAQKFRGTLYEIDIKTNVVKMLWTKFDSNAFYFNFWSMFAFAENDIWVLSSRGSLFRWNGKDLIEINLNGDDPDDNAEIWGIY